MSRLRRLSVATLLVLPIRPGQTRETATARTPQEVIDRTMPDTQVIMKMDFLKPIAGRCIFQNDAIDEKALGILRSNFQPFFYKTVARA